MSTHENDILDELFRRNQEAERLFRRRNACQAESKRMAEKAASYERRCFAQLDSKDHFMAENAEIVLKFCGDYSEPYDEDHCLVCNRRKCKKHSWHLHIFKGTVFGRPGNPRDDCPLCDYGIPLKSEFFFE